jgi:hypothetical protein
VAHKPKEGNDPVPFCNGTAGLPGRLSGTLSQCRAQEKYTKEHYQWGKYPAKDTNLYFIDFQ